MNRFLQKQALRTSIALRGTPASAQAANTDSSAEAATLKMQTPLHLIVIITFNEIEYNACSPDLSMFFFEPYACPVPIAQDLPKRLRL